jgi:integrase
VDGVRSRSTATNPQTVLEETQPVAATVVATAAYTGLRKSELRGLRWMDLEGNQLRIQRTVWNTHIEDKTKTPNSRAPVPLVPMLQRLLESHRNGFPQDGFIFAGEKKKKQPLNLSNLARRVIVPALDEARAAKKTDVEWHGWHASWARDQSLCDSDARERDPGHHAPRGCEDYEEALH